MSVCISYTNWSMTSLAWSKEQFQIWSTMTRRVWRSSSAKERKEYVIATSKRRKRFIGYMLAKCSVRD